MIGGCGALPHAPAGRSSPCTPGTSDGRANKHAGAGRACAQGTRPARGPVGAWRASHAMLWGVWKSSGVSRSPSCPICPMGPTAKLGDVPRRLERGSKREDDGREGAISGRLARKATGVSPSGFARTLRLCGNGGGKPSFQASKLPNFHRRYRRFRRCRSAR